MGTSRHASRTLLAHKMVELEAAYRDANERNRDFLRYKSGQPESRSSYSRNMDTRSIQMDTDRELEREREITRLKYTVSKLEEKLKISKAEAENAKRDLKNEREGRAIIDKKIKSLEKENKDLKAKLGSVRVKLGVANANYNVGKHETDDLRKSHQENQIQIARLEERLSAANQELDRLRNPLNPNGSEEVKRKINTDKKELKSLRVELQKLEELRTVDEIQLHDKDEEILALQEEINRDRLKLANLETSLEMAEMTVQAERASREDFERKNQQLMKEKENFDEQMKQLKVKLGIAQASRNVNVREAELLRKQDEEYQYTVQNLEKRLSAAKAEIDRLQSRYLETGKTAKSLQSHNTRLKKHRNTFNMEFIAPRSFDGVSGWTPPRQTPKGRVSGDRISVNSIDSLKSGKGEQNIPVIRNVKIVKQGRTSAP